MGAVSVYFEFLETTLHIFHRKNTHISSFYQKKNSYIFRAQYTDGNDTTLCLNNCEDNDSAISWYVQHLCSPSPIKEACWCGVLLGLQGRASLSNLTPSQQPIKMTMWSALEASRQIYTQNSGEDIQRKIWCLRNQLFRQISALNLRLLTNRESKKQLSLPHIWLTQQPLVTQKHS